MLLLGFLIVAALLATWYYLLGKAKYWSNQGVNQTNPLPLFGDNCEFNFGKRTMAEWLTKTYNLHPNARYIGCYNFTTPTLMLKDPDLIKQITVRDFDSFLNHVELVDRESDPLWSNNLFALKDERWKEMRHLMSTTFTSSKIKVIYDLISEAAEYFVEHFQNISSNEAVLELEMGDVSSRFTNDTIASVAFGINVDSLRYPHNSFYLQGKELTSITGIFNLIRFLALQNFPKLCKVLGIKMFSDASRIYVNNFVEEIIKLRQEKNIVRPDIIQTLLDASRAEDSSEKDSTAGKGKRLVKISHDDIFSQAALFFFAGFDPVSTVINFTAYELAVNKEIQDKLREEIRQISLKGKITYDALQQMKYLDMVLSGSHSIIPSTDFHLI